MPKLCGVDECTSCQACFNACPFGALTMKKSQLSSLIPIIDNEKCRECGLCEKSCPIINQPKYNNPLKAIALYSRNEKDRSTCSSGGAATVLAKRILQSGGVVYGATIFGGVPKFIRVNEIENLELLKGSKYVYCDTGLIYKSVKRDLASGIRVLFIGLPCNVAGLKQYLRHEYDNLTTIDLVCHGTPPSEYLHQHLQKKLGYRVNQCRNITFRGKKDFYTTAYDDRGEIIYSKNQYEDEYFTAFMHGIFYKPVCYKCPFAQPQRISDITVGDFWGIGRDALNGYTGKISLALLNTQKGADLFSEISRATIWEERPIEEALGGNKQLRHPTSITEQARAFRKQYEKSHNILDAFKSSGIMSLVRKNTLRRILLYIPKQVLKRIR